eukprot:Seg14167.1 transcript_id=Seg14167.1/GoldUCD/mRNA.D3Y31 product="GTP 3' 8-cyclase" protein_id=Seg14167.1/GoldUCD/D3Y31
MPAEIFGANYSFLPKEEILRFGEIETLTRAFVAQGVRKIRLTGGEPLLRKDLSVLVEKLASIEGVEDLAMTTNAALLERYARELKLAGLHRVTVSLDAIDAEVFGEMNGVGAKPEKVIGGIDAALAEGLGVKVNAVIKKGVNDQEILPLARLAHERNVPIRYIEYMDTGNVNGWEMGEVLESEKVLENLSEKFDLKPVEAPNVGDTAVRYVVNEFEDTGFEVGLISSVSKPFCRDCNRARLTADGNVSTCLFAAKGHDVKTLLRGGASDAELAEWIQSLWGKRDDRYSELRTQQTGIIKQEMSYLGGHNYYGRYGKGSKDFPIEEREQIEVVAGKGIVGDRFFDYKPDYKGQITFFQWEVYEAVRDEVVKGDLEPTKFRRNVMVEGIDLNELIGKRFTLGGIEFTGSCEAKPCFWMDEACAEGTHEFLKGNKWEGKDDVVAVEEPLQITVDGHPIAVVMRTPGDDEDLVMGFLITEGVLTAPSQISRIDLEQKQNHALVFLKDHVVVDYDRLKRNLYSASSCGICGKASIEAVCQVVRPIEDGFSVSRNAIINSVGKMREKQDTFQTTGGIHAAGLFDATGNLLVLREDVGRHNAIDKLIGSASVSSLNLKETFLLVSGRVSFEVVQKALVAQIPMVCAISAPTSLAVEFAKESNQTLIGFLRGETMNVYSGKKRVVEGYS